MNNDSDKHRMERPRQRKKVIPSGTIKMLSVSEIAHRYEFHENTVRRWVTVDKLKSIRYGPGNKIYIAKKDVDNFIQKHYY